MTEIDRLAEIQKRVAGARLHNAGDDLRYLLGLVERLSARAEAAEAVTAELREQISQAVIAERMIVQFVTHLPFMKRHLLSRRRRQFVVERVR